MAAPTAKQTGPYYVDGTATVSIAKGDTVTCVLGTGSEYQELYFTVGPVESATFETIPLNSLVFLHKGEQPTTFCTDYTGDSGTVFYNGSMTATLIDNAYISGPAVRLIPASRRGLLPALKHA